LSYIINDLCDKQSLIKSASGADFAELIHLVSQNV